MEKKQSKADEIIFKGLRQDYPELSDASDGELLETVRQVDSPKLSAKEYRKSLMDAYEVPEEYRDKTLGQKIIKGASDFGEGLKEGLGQSGKDWNALAGKVPDATKATGSFLKQNVLKPAYESAVSPFNEIDAGRAGSEYEHSLNEMQKTSYQDLINRGYSPEIAQHVMKQRVGTEQELAQGQLEAGQEGVKQGAEAGASYAAAPIGPGLALGTAEQITKMAVTSTLAKHVIGGAGGLGAYNGMQAALEGRGAGEVMHEIMSGMAMGAAFGTFTAGAEKIGSTILKNIAKAGAARQARIAQAATAASASAVERQTTMANRYADSFNPEWLDTSYKNIPGANDPTVAPEIVAASLLKQIMGDDVSGAMPEDAVGKIAEKIRHSRDMFNRNNIHIPLPDAITSDVSAQQMGGMKLTAKDALELVNQVPPAHGYNEINPPGAMQADQPISPMRGEQTGQNPTNIHGYSDDIVRGQEATGSQFQPPQGVTQIEGLQSQPVIKAQGGVAPELNTLDLGPQSEPPTQHPATFEDFMGGIKPYVKPFNVQPMEGLESTPIFKGVAKKSEKLPYAKPETKAVEKPTKTVSAKKEPVFPSKGTRFQLSDKIEADKLVDQGMGDKATIEGAEKLREALKTANPKAKEYLHRVIEQFQKRADEDAAKLKSLGGASPEGMKPAGEEYKRPSEQALRYTPNSGEVGETGSKEWFLNKIDDLRHGWQDMPEHKMNKAPAGQPGSDYPRSYDVGEVEPNEVAIERYKAYRRNKRLSAFNTSVTGMAENVASYMKGIPEEEIQTIFKMSDQLMEEGAIENKKMTSIEHVKKLDDFLDHLKEIIEKYGKDVDMSKRGGQ